MLPGRSGGSVHLTLGSEKSYVCKKVKGGKPTLLVVVSAKMSAKHGVTARHLLEYASSVSDDKGKLLKKRAKLVGV